MVKPWPTKVIRPTTKNKMATAEPRLKQSPYPVKSMMSDMATRVNISQKMKREKIIIPVEMRISINSSLVKVQFIFFFGLLGLALTVLAFVILIVPSLLYFEATFFTAMVCFLSSVFLAGAA